MKCSGQRNDDEEIVVLCPEHKALVEDEREACAEIAEDNRTGSTAAIATAIRARNNLT